MIAILIPNRTIYDCNLDQLGPNMIAMSTIVLESPDYDFGWITWEQIFDHCNHIWSFLKKIAIIYGPLSISDCNHIESLLWPRLQSYLVLTATLIAIILGPFHKNYCNHKWSNTILYNNFCLIYITIYYYLYKFVLKT